MVYKRESIHIVWLILLLLVLASNFALYRSSFGLNLLPTKTNGVVLGSILDLTIVAPVLFLAWQRKMSWKYLIVLMAGGLMVARFMIPMEYLAPFKTITLAGFVIEGALVLLEVLLLVTLFKYLPEIIQTVKKSPLPLLFSFSHAVDEKVRKHPIIQVICSEMLMFYYAFCIWKKKPQEKDNTFTLYKKSSLIAFQVMMIHAIVIETIGIHWWLHDKSFILSLILLVINIYSVLLFLGDIQALRFNPLQIEHESMYVSLGLMKRMEIRWEDIEEIIEDPDVLEQKFSKNTIDFIARDFEKVYPSVLLKLKYPVEATLLMGVKKFYDQVAIRVDDSERFKELVKQKL
ncbi:beta-carotene 15,15'-monooxygenase [Sporosarcina sp. FSL K6-1540]|uniref:beta-carotene 15,15'-monooxygenase n=1 Tax=Sporosarcina TaxID=1569 RepID=UPI00078E9F88|nr:MULTISPECIES: beta-carotene 15,15'-monooxygenase [Sporosarcina]AMQ08152.1 beta-carotene 15,15'-monooxygenase [Sporosarcina psychrophila]QNK87959.1 beta-carotene 15,15'-monooxygenase [Sporosarcina sp. resist]